MYIIPHLYVVKFWKFEFSSYMFWILIFLEFHIYEIVNVF